MSIAFTKYVDITSSVAATTFANERELIGRIFSTNVFIPTQTTLEFTDADSVGVYFGTSSEEYKRALYYFSFISKSITSPNKISFSRWVDVAVPPTIHGKKITATLADFQAVLDGSFYLTINGVTHLIGPINFSTVLSFADVASLVQITIRSYTGSGAMWSSSIVGYDTSGPRFNFSGGLIIDATISVAPSVGPDMLSLLGWNTGAIISNGSVVETITTALTNSVNDSNNFGSFLFIPALTLAQQTEAAIWNDALDNLYQFYTPVSLANYVAYSAALAPYSGTGMTVISPENPGVHNEYAEQSPMNVLASTDYSAQNSVQNYMYQVFNLTPSVTDTATSNALDTARVNYYGSTQQSGNIINFYQRGVLFGGSDNPLDMNTYANEQWLKDAAGAQIMSLFLALNEIPANAKGKLIILTGLQSVIDRALFNGTISVGKALNTTQQLFISQITGDNNAWKQVQNIGYWIDCRIVLVGLEYKAIYILIYTKDDVIRKVEGSHILV